MPRFAEENEFYRVYFGDESIWLDVEDDPDEGLKTVDGHFYIRHIRSFAGYQWGVYERHINPVSTAPVSIKIYDWVNFHDDFHSANANYSMDDIYKDLNEEPPSTAVVMAKNDESSTDWMVAMQNELVDTVCVYSIKPDEACSKCPDEKFCRFAGSEREEIECVCQNTNEGEQCEVDLCSHKICENGGFCQINYDTVQCICPYPFYGANCESSSILLLSGTSSMIINSLGK